MRIFVLGFLAAVMTFLGITFARNVLLKNGQKVIPKSTVVVEGKTLPTDETNVDSSAIPRQVHAISERSLEKIKQIKVLCWIPSRTSEGKIIDRIMKTWAPSCDLLLFTATKANEENNVVKIDYPLDGNLWNMVHPAWTYIEERYMDQYDWFVKLDDDTYFTGHNFKALVQDLDPEQFYYLGHTAYEMTRMVSDPQAPFNLGAGHALSRASLRRLGPFLPDSKKPLPEGFKKKCDRWNSWAEDFMLQNCLWIAGIGKPNISRDRWGRENFMSFAPEDNFIAVRRPDSVSWFWRGKPKEVGSGARCCSARPILWHGLKDSRTGCFYYLQYFLYDVLVDPVPS